MELENCFFRGLRRGMRVTTLIIFTLAALSAYADTYTDPVYRVVYSLNETDHTATIADENRSIHSSNESAIVIPATITDNDVEYTVTTMAPAAFRATAISSIDIQAQITDLTESCFQDCANLVEVKLPSSITAIPSNAFRNCEKLKTINLDNIKTIGGFAFEVCRSLPCPDFSKMTRVGESAFSYCDNLGKVEIPNGTNFDHRCFMGSTVTSVEFVKNVENSVGTNMGYWTFSSVKGLKYLKIPEFVTAVPWFPYIESLTEVDLSEMNENVSIPSYGFSGCHNLTKVTFPKKLKIIGMYAFSGTGITTLKLPELEEIGGNAFKSSKVENIIWPDNEIPRVGDSSFESTQVKSVQFPSWMKVIPTYMFAHCQNLTSVELPSSLTTINLGAFYSSKITGVDFPASTKIIGNSAFERNQLSSVTFNDGLESIGPSAFCNNQLTEISIPESVKGIEQEAFSRNSLTAVTFPKSEDATFTPINFGIDVFSINSFSDFKFPAWMKTVPEGILRDNPNLASVTFAAGTDSIMARAFYGDKVLQIGVFPKSIKYYGPQAFYQGGMDLPDEEYLTTIHIGNNIHYDESSFQLAKIKEVIFDDCDFTLESNVFQDVTTVKKISFPDCMTAIPPGICNGWVNLTEVDWPPVIEKIGANAFYGCTSLNFTPNGQSYGDYTNVLDFTKWPFDNHGEDGKTLKLEENCFGNTKIDHIVWPENNTGFETAGIFMKCYWLHDVTIPAWMESVPNYMFYQCNGLSQITWEIDDWDDAKWAEYGGRDNYVLTIGDNSFNSISTSVITWPNVRTTLGNGAFAGNRVATKIIWPDSPASMSANVFNGCASLTEPTTVPDYISVIPAFTFLGCSSLKSFVLPESVTYIDAKAFEYCSSLESVELKGNVTELGIFVFDSCRNLKTFTAHYPIDKMPWGGFANCNALQNINLNNGEKKLSYVCATSFNTCTSLPEFPDVIDGNTEVLNNAFYATPNLKSITLPTVLGYNRDYQGKVTYSQVAQNSGLQAVKFVKDKRGELHFADDEFVGTPLLGVSTYFDGPLEIAPYRGADRGENKGILLVGRDLKYRFMEAGYGKLWNIVEATQPKLELQGDLKSEFTPGETVNHYTATLLWEVCESDLNPNGNTEYTLLRDGKKRALIVIGPKEIKDEVDEDNIKLKAETAAYPISITMFDENGTETAVDMSTYAADFVYQTGENTFTMIYANQHAYLYFNPTTSHRLGLNEKMGAKSWFIFKDIFDSPDLNGLNVPSSYSYTLKMNGFSYQEPRNNENYEPDDEGQYWHLEDFSFDELESEPCKVYTSMAVPSLTFAGTYTHDQILDDRNGSLPVSQPIDKNGDVSVTYAFADQSHVLHEIDSKAIIDHITSYEINSVLRSGPTEWETIDIQGDMSKASGEMIVPKDKEPGVGSSFQLVTHTKGRGDFGSRVVTIPGTPKLNIELVKTMIYGSEADHDHNTVIRNDIVLHPDVTEMSFPSEIPPSTHHVIGVWRTVDRQVIANAPRRAGEESSDPSASSETLIHHSGSDEVEHWWNCSACNDAQGYNANDESCVYTDHVAAEHSQASLNTNYRVRMYVQTPYNDNQWMIAEAQAGREEVLTDIRNVGIDSDTPIYFNLQGMRVQQPRHGEILIRVDRTGSHRIRYTEE